MSNKKSESLARVAEAAIEAFSRYPYDEVLVGDIAAKARCSTATVYEAFGGKDQLYEHVRARLFDQRPRQTPLEAPVGAPSLAYLVDYLLELFETLTGPAIGLLTTPAAGAAASGYKPWEHTGLDFAAITAEVSRCMEAGLLRRGDPHAVAFLLYAGISYEPMLYNLMCREPIALDAAAILRSIFDPLTTDRGAAALRVRLAQIARPPCDDAAPATLHAYMHYGAQTTGRKRALTQAIDALRAAAAAYFASRRGRP